jgi:hypothetical protein
LFDGVALEFAREPLQCSNSLALPLPLLTLSAVRALAGPPADLDACLKLSAETARAANVQSEAAYAKFHFKFLDLNAACGALDFVGAEKIAADIRAAFPPNK